MLLQSTISSSPLQCLHPQNYHPLSMGFRSSKFSFQALTRRSNTPLLISSIRECAQIIIRHPKMQADIWKGIDKGILYITNFKCLLCLRSHLIDISDIAEPARNLLITDDTTHERLPSFWMSAFLYGTTMWLSSAKDVHASEAIELDSVYEIGELFELGIQLSYLLLLLGLLGAGSFFVIRQVLLRRELDLSAKELQEQVRSGESSATGLFELGAVMLRRKFYPAATKYLQQAIQKWDGDDQDLAQVHNALGVSYVRDGKLDKGIIQFETAVKIQPGYVTAWNNLGDAYDQKKDIKSALRAFEEVLLFDPNNKIARPRRDELKERVQMYKGVPVINKIKRRDDDYA